MEQFFSHQTVGVMVEERKKWHGVELSKLNPSILPQSVSSLGENANKELSGLVGSIGGRHEDVVTRVQMQLPPHTPEWQG